MFRNSINYLWIFFCPEIEDQGAYCFCSVCHSVIPSFCHSVNLSETLTLLINFEQWKLELLEFHMSIPSSKTFLWVPTFFNLWPWPWGLTYFFKKNINLANIFWTVSARALIFHMSIPWDYFRWYQKFWPCDLDLGVWYNLKTLSKYLSLWSWSSLDLPISKGICVSQTHLVWECFFQSQESMETSIYWNIYWNFWNI